MSRCNVILLVSTDVMCMRNASLYSIWRAGGWNNVLQRWSCGFFCADTVRVSCIKCVYSIIAVRYIKEIQRHSDSQVETGSRCKFKIEIQTCPKFRHIGSCDSDSHNDIDRSQSPSQYLEIWLPQLFGVLLFSCINSECTVEPPGVS